MRKRLRAIVHALAARRGIVRYTDRDEVRAKILGALVEYDGVDPTDDIWMMEPQERTDAIMAALFARKSEE